MVLVVMITSILVVVVVVKVLGRVAVGVLVINVLVDVVMYTLFGVEIIVVAPVVVALAFAVPISYCVDALSVVVVDELMDALADVITRFVTGIGVEVLADANGNVCASLMTVLEFAAPKP